MNVGLFSTGSYSGIETAGSMAYRPQTPPPSLFSASSGGCDSVSFSSSTPSASSSSSASCF